MREALPYIGIGVLVVASLLVRAVVRWLGDFARARRIRREEAELAKRMNEEAYKRHMRGLAVLLLVAVLPGCHADDDKTTTGPSAAVSPSPGAGASPSASPTPAYDRCQPTSCEIDGEGNVCGIGAFQPRRVTLLVRDATRTPIDNSCVFPREATWSQNGQIRPTGPRNGYAFDYYAESSGDATITATLAGVRPIVSCGFNVHIEESCR